jgi:exonuclease V gamma subunit
MSQLRTVAKLVRFSPDEIARVSERAWTCGRTVARYIRETALGAIPKAHHHVDRDALLRELARTGRDLARLAQLAESTSVDCFSPGERDQLLAALVDHRAALRTVAGECAEDGRAA